MSAVKKAAAAAAAGPSARSGGRLRSARQACRQVFGIPDYERYLAHMASHHAGEPLLSQREFFARAIERKYGNSGPRCC